MRDLSLHILDLAQNSVVANARSISISLSCDLPNDTLTFTINDDGKGMSPDFLAKVKSPFSTTRTTRKVGLGIPMMDERARMTGGGLDITSELGVGTTVAVRMVISHIDRPPLGDIAGTLLSLIVMADDNLDYVIELTGIGDPFQLSTKEVREAMDGAPLSDPIAVTWIKESLDEAVAPYLAIDKGGLGR